MAFISFIYHPINNDEPCQICSPDYLSLPPSSDSQSVSITQSKLSLGHHIGFHWVWNQPTKKVIFDLCVSAVTQYINEALRCLWKTFTNLFMLTSEFHQITRIDSHMRLKLSDSPRSHLALYDKLHDLNPGFILSLLIYWFCFLFLVFWLFFFTTSIPYYVNISWYTS